MSRAIHATCSAAGPWGCDGYVWKPFDLKRLIEEVDKVRVRVRDDHQRAHIRRHALGEANLLLRASE